MVSAIVVVPRTHWVNGWFLRLCARPVVRVDGVDRVARWGQPTDVEVAPGPLRVGVGARYRGTRAVLGVEEMTIDVSDGQRVALEARNGFFDHQPFAVIEQAGAQRPTE